MFTELDFPVQLVDIPHPLKPTKERIDGRKAIIRPDTGAVLNIVSDRYQLVRHLDLFQVLGQAVDHLGIRVKDTKVRVGDGGGSAKVTWRLDRQVDIGGGDLVDLQIIGRNSYNYTAMVGLQLGGFRFICSNGLVVGKVLAAYKKRHVPSLKVEEAQRQITEMLEQQEKVSREWTRWGKIEYPTTRFAEWLNGMGDRLSKRTREEVLDYFAAQPDRVRQDLPKRYTGWEAYNSLTWAATHRVRTRTTQRALVAEEIMQDVAGEFAAAELRN